MTLVVDRRAASPRHQATSARRARRTAVLAIVLAVGGCNDQPSPARDAVEAMDGPVADAMGPQPRAGKADGDFAFKLTALSAMPSDWAAPRLLDGAYAPTFQRTAQGWHRKGVAIIPPNKRILIGPRYLGGRATTEPSTVKGMVLSLASQSVDLKLFPMPPPERYLFGAITEQYFKRTSGWVFSHGVALDDLKGGSVALRATSLVELNKTVIPWVDEVQLTVRPYLRTVFAAGPPPAPLPQASGLWVVPAGATVIRNATVITATGADPIEDGLVAVAGQWIVGVGAATKFDLSAGPKEIDAQGGFVIPGLINAHIHYSSDMHRPAKDWLKSGVTTMVDVGGKLLAVLSAREAFADSTDPRPDLLVAGPILEAPETGHQTDYGTPGFHAISSVPQAAAAAAATADWGVNLLKICADCASPTGVRLTVQQIRAVVRVAHERNLKVMAHATTDQGLADALAGGVDSVTHIPPLSDARIQQMVKAGVLLVPTLSATYRSLTAMINDAKRAHSAGVPLATGNDFPAQPRGLPLLELQYLERAGMGRMEVLEASTRVAAEVAGVESVVGTVAAGKIADLVLLRSNPLTKLTNLESIRLVVKRGVLVPVP